MGDLYDSNYREIYKVYEDGKHRRYTLLFAVNGAAAAIVKLIPEEVDFQKICYLLVVLTTSLSADIAVFGQRVRVAAKDNTLGRTEGIFSLYGKIVLGIVGFFLAVGWLYAARGDIKPL